VGVGGSERNAFMVIFAIGLGKNQEQTPLYLSITAADIRRLSGHFPVELARSFVLAVR